ncbi:esterase/lipase family protein [Thauera aromatica]|uniref:AB hydrolase-1 domain-containing protein n=1 Tax=Thauera aromatica K172 TaxID=44139 RepID=A0A2R4BS41_THAAR|nr:alpha/beta hydrolase [Thauera aromatica]AVR90033.1 hypothetical protein Tharo_3152 [Thauera aromatica K172]
MTAPGDIVLVHGLWMHGWVFTLQRRRLQRRGWRSHAFSYRSVRGTLDGAADALAEFVAALGETPVHLLGHSLGGLVVLDMLARRRPPQVARAVLLGAPCQGSHSAAVLLRLPVLRGLVGRGLAQWLARPLPQVDAAVDIGTIAGNRPLGSGRLLPGLPTPNDGMVAVSETRWPGARDHIVLPVTHSQMLVSRICLEQAQHFLLTGAFDHRAAGAPPA